MMSSYGRRRASFHWPWCLGQSSFTSYPPLRLHLADVLLAADAHEVALPTLGEEPLPRPVAVSAAVEDDDDRIPSLRDVLDAPSAT